MVDRTEGMTAGAPRDGLEGYGIDLRATLEPGERTYDRFFACREGTAHLVFAERPGTFWRRGSRRLIFREMLP